MENYQHIREMLNGYHKKDLYSESVEKAISKKLNSNVCENLYYNKKTWRVGYNKEGEEWVKYEEIQEIQKKMVRNSVAYFLPKIILSDCLRRKTKWEFDTIKDKAEYLIRLFLSIDVKFEVDTLVVPMFSYSDYQMDIGILLSLIVKCKNKLYLIERKTPTWWDVYFSYCDDNFKPEFREVYFDKIFGKEGNYSKTHFTFKALKKEYIEKLVLNDYDDSIRLSAIEEQEKFNNKSVLFFDVINGNGKIHSSVYNYMKMYNIKESKIIVL